MKEATLSRLYFESIAFPTTATFWFALAVIVHVALLFSPPLTRNRPRQEIVFLQGDAGVELELLAAERAAYPAGKRSAKFKPATSCQRIPRH